jgi:hypothetical protein
VDFTDWIQFPVDTLKGKARINEIVASAVIFIFVYQRKLIKNISVPRTRLNKTFTV